MEKIIDGKAIAEKVRSEVKEQVKELKSRAINPCLAVILVGDDPASSVYVASKTKALQEVGMTDRTFKLSNDTTQQALEDLLDELNGDDTVHGILVQFPLPPHLDSQRITDKILPQKDVDGFHIQNAGALVCEKDSFIPCTPLGILRLLKESGTETAGKHACIIGRSHFVGRPLSVLLSQKPLDCTVTLCHSATKNLSDFTKTADIVIAACGRAGLITGDMLKAGAVVIDVGINRVADSSKKSGYALKGDVDFESAAKVASAITPVPGGVGPMTIAMLVFNVAKAAGRK